MNYELLNKAQRKNELYHHGDFGAVGRPKDNGYRWVVFRSSPLLQDEGIEDEIRQLENMFSSYDALQRIKCSLMISECIDAIHKKKRSWHGLNLNEVKECVSQHKFCLISGEGGIGKSFFVKCLEESLENEQIPHLCIYGKFEKDTENIDVNEIINNHKNRFVFIVDAINEMSEYGQRELLNLLTELKKYLGIRIVITYRTNAMDENLLVKFKEIAEANIVFRAYHLNLH